MWKRLSKKKKILLIFIATIIVLLFFAPIIAKNYINNNGKELIGRKVNVSSLSINYFTGSINVKDIVIFEENETDTILYAGKIHVNPNVIACIKQKYTIQNIEIDKLKCNTILTGNKTNFDAIVNHFADTTTVIEEDTTPVYFALEKISVTNSHLTYTDNNLNSYTGLKNFNVKTLKEFSSDNNELDLASDFEFESGGKVNTEFKYNLTNTNYDLALNSNQFDLNVFLPYLQDFMLTNDMGGKLNTNITAKGSANNPTNVNILGSLNLEGFYLKDSINTDVLSLSDFTINIDSINPSRDIFNLKSVTMNTPFAKYDAYANTDNFSEMFQLSDSGEVVIESEYSSNVFVMMKNYIVDAVKEIHASNFSIDTVRFDNIKLQYIDNAMYQKFVYLISEGNLTAQNVKSDAENMFVNLTALLNNTGKLKANATLHPQKPEDVTVHLTIDNLTTKDLSPYFLQYISLPVTKGKFYMTSDLEIKDKKLVNTNLLKLQSFKLGKKQDVPGAYKLPFKVAVAMLKDRNGDIPLNINVDGNLSDPNYNVWKVVGQIFKELILKAATAPYNLIAGGLKTDEESTKKILIKQLAYSLDEKHYKKLDNLANVLIEKPQLSLIIDSYYNLKNESNKMALVLSKAKYLNITNSIFSTNQLTSIDSINNNDSLFVNHINKQLKTNENIPIEEKATKLITPDVLKQKIEHHIQSQLKTIHEYLISKNINPNQINKIIELTNIRYDATNTNNFYFSLGFDVLDNINDIPTQ
jgi:hypothetical protein